MSKKSAKEAPPEGSDAAAAAPKKSRKKLMIIGLVAVLVLGGGGYAAFGGGGKPAPPVPGAVFPMTSITINLSSGHFLKLGIALQATKKSKEAVGGSKALDIAIGIYSNKSIAELSSTVARGKVKKEMVDAVVKKYDGTVMDVYLTEFVMQ